MGTAASPRRVCIVDDEPGVRDLLELMCESARLAAATYDSAESFLAELGSGALNCGVLVLDVDLPGMSGLELLATLRQRGFQPPVILISGGHEACAAGSAAKFGAAAFFGKPFDVRVVRQAICDLLAHHPDAGPRSRSRRC